jgi:tyrosine-specific transport protein
MHFNKLIGSIFLLIGSLLGGGILALPLVSSGADFFSALCLITFIWLLQLVTGLLFLEVNLAFPSSDTNFSSMAQHTIGRFGKTLTAISYLILLVALVSAYVSAGGSLLHKASEITSFPISPSIGSLVFVIIFGTIIFLGTRAVDYINRLFLSVKGFLLVLVIIFAAPKIECANLFSTTQSSKYLWAAAPIFLCAFGYHILIPVLSSYLNYDKKSLRKVLFIGTFLSWILYISWLTITIGIVPQNDFLKIAQEKESVGGFVFLLASLLKNKWVEGALHLFTNITVTTCFLGVGLGLFNFLADLFKRSKSLSGRLQITLFTFIPPTLFALFYPEGFIFALGYAALSVAFSHVILPAWMVFKLRKKQIPSPYQVKGGNFLLGSIVLIGIILMILQILVYVGTLPILGK